MLITENNLRKSAEVYKHSEIKHRFLGHDFLIIYLSPDCNPSILFSSRSRAKQGTDRVYSEVFKVWFIFLSSLPLYFHVVLPSLRQAAQKHNEQGMFPAWSLQALAVSCLVETFRMLLADKGKPPQRLDNIMVISIRKPIPQAKRFSRQPSAWLQFLSQHNHQPREGHTRQDR